MEENQTKGPKKKVYTRWWFWTLVVIFVIIITNAGQNGENTASNNSSITQNQPSICDIDSNTLAKQAEKVDYKQLSKDPDSFQGKISTFKGQILQIQQSGNEGILRLSVTNEGYGIWSLNDVIYVTYHQPTQAVQDDVVTIMGKLTGSQTYTSQANYQITVPSMDVCSVENQPTKIASSAPTSEVSSKTTPVVTQPTPAPTQTPSISCYSDSQCGTNSPSGSPSCQGNAVYQNYITYTCDKAGTPQSSCSNSTTQQLQQTCATGQTCSNGACNSAKTWHTVSTFSGQTQKNTSTFTIQGSQWRITWQETGDGYFGADAESPDGDITKYCSIANLVGSGSDSTYCYAPGTYYISVNTANSWSMTVEDYY